MLVFACLILIKAKSRAKFMIQGLVQRENKYKVVRFAEFVESPKYEAVITKFKKALNQIRKMESSLKKVKRFYFFIKYYHLEEIFKGSISDSEFQRIISSQLLGTIKEKMKKNRRKTSPLLT